MGKHTFLSIESPLPFKPCQAAIVTGRTQIPIRLYRLRIELEIARNFMIDDVRIGTRLALPAPGRIPATNFSHGLGANFDAGDAYPGDDVYMFVTNISPRSVPFIATWAALVIPQHWNPRTERYEPLDPGDAGGPLDEMLDSRIGRVPEVRGRPPTPTLREPAGFGWDPFGND
jgi:hypothetical protein